MIDSLKLRKKMLLKKRFEGKVDFFSNKIKKLPFYG